jgi:hypothetical protein
MSYKPPKCDACNRRIRRNQHEFVLRDFVTGQIVGRYHARPECQAAAATYFVAGAVLRGTYYHPPKCSAELELCDGGLPEAVA